MSAAGLPLLRARSGGHARVTFAELFFDLVFVFAVTRLSHALAHHLDLVGAAQAAVLFLAVWWVWINTAWVTNWADPDRLQVRFLLFAAMFGGLVLGIAIPGAFGEAGLAFAAAFVAIELGRCAWMLRAIPRTEPALRRNFQRILFWLALPAPLWLLGALLPPGPRLVVWALAIAVWTAGPLLRFATPRLGRSSTADWNVDGAHMAERCSLFVIIALGEGLLVTGSIAAELPLRADTAAAFLMAFLGTVAMWWVYFHIGETRGTRLITRHADPGHIARIGYTYLHMPIVAGIVLSAVGDDLALRHPMDPAGLPHLAALLGGPALYLAGLGAFKRLSLGWMPLSHSLGLAAFGLVALLGLGAPLLALAAAATSILIAVAVWEHLSLHGGEPA